MDNEITVSFVQFYTGRKVVVRQVKDESDTYGGSALVRHLFSGTVTNDQLSEVLDLDGYRCQHEYDCCGQWYAHSATIKRDGLRTLVRQRMYQNV